MDLSEVDQDPEPFLATIARLASFDGKTREVAILAECLYSCDQSYYDFGTQFYCISLSIPAKLYSQIGDSLPNVCESIKTYAKDILGPGSEILSGVAIRPKVEGAEGWREKAKAYVAGQGITNQGRVRSDNLAPKSSDGLLFRSEPEIHLYNALKSQGVSFAPLPVFIKGGKTYSRIEPDFIILRAGLCLCVEIDGDTVHHETPAEASARLAVLSHEGVIVERYPASECDNPDKAQALARKIIATMDKHKTNRG